MSSIEGYKTLAASIIAAATKDFINALISGHKPHIEEGLQFFRSQYFELLADGINGEQLISKCRRIAREVRRFEISIFYGEQENREYVKELVHKLSDQGLLFARRHLRGCRQIWKSTRNIMWAEMKKRGLIDYFYGSAI